MRKIWLVLGLVLIASGFGAIFAAWLQVSNQSLETGQIPYLVSGGLGGLGLIIIGAVVILVDTVLKSAAELRRVWSEGFENLIEKTPVETPRRLSRSRTKS